VYFFYEVTGLRYFCYEPGNNAKLMHRQTWEIVMQMFQELLSRIRWDEDFAKAEFAIGYYDRVADRVIVVPFIELSFPVDHQLFFELLDSHGEVRRIPFHRVRDIHRNGHCIWRRQVH
jgi:uncharacterized protein (UPF0248 family)